MRTCPVKASSPRLVQDLRRASAASHNMGLAFRLASKHIERSDITACVMSSHLVDGTIVSYWRRPCLKSRILRSISLVKDSCGFPQCLMNSMVRRFSQNVFQRSYLAGKILLAVYGTQKSINVFILINTWFYPEQIKHVADKLFL
jgi:hypothetical protein